MFFSVKLIVNSLCLCAQNGTVINVVQESLNHELHSLKGRSTMSLYLGYDASCGTCRELAHKIQEEVNEESLKVLPLGNTKMSSWREQVFGDNPPWQPTLIEIDDAGGVKGWTGVMLGWAIIDRLGIRMSVRLATLLGRFRMESSPNENKRKVARRPFVGFTIGVVGAVALLKGGFSPKAVAADGSSITMGKNLEKSTEAPEGEAEKRILPYLKDGGEIKTLLELAYSRDDSLIRSLATRDEAMSAVDAAINQASHNNGGKEVEIQGVNHALHGGGVLEATSVGLGALTAFVYNANDGSQVSTSVKIFESPREDADTFSLVATSVDQSRTITIQHNAVKGGVVGAMQAASGCDAKSCYAQGACFTCVCTSLDKKCAFNNCGPCAVACNPWSPWQVCLICLGVWCPIALTVNGCCKEERCGWRESCA